MQLRWIRWLSLFLAGVVLAGCSTINSVGDKVGGWIGDDDPDAPASLEDIVEKVNPKISWNKSMGSGTDGLWVDLKHKISGEMVYAASVDGTVSAVKLSSGSTVWERELDEVVMTGVATGEGNVYVGTESGNLVALDRIGGQDRWSISLLSEILSPPAVAAGVVVVRTVDGKLVGVNAEDGLEIWRYQREVPVLTLRGTSSPVIVGDIVYAGLDGGEVVALGLQDGRELWVKSVTSPRGRTEIERMVDIDADPAVADGVVYVISYQGDLAAINGEQGDLVWKRKLSGVTAPTVYGPYLFLSDAEGNVWAFDRKDGSALWKQDGLKNRNLTSPLVSGTNLVVGDAEGYLHWISGEDGHFAGRVKTDSDGVSATPLPFRNQVISYGNGGKLSAVTQD
ncbi:MAG: outer membrane protein assembly factor BamB [Gammaproteobacteria bacterium]|uniref:Outer membrane protein assembly factor BamB n=1 Tax=Candidatus Thiopontia autotrophica TaxID=2841688 RepID=A0A8J6PA78_9GAMM|nr:outer membrane protein assembly factor BamB [Candidatus Thiopontia autotrophica]MBL6969733.1 outer membrane protein assembly factor BamB [Gammaproteobacteria bacterium]